MNSQKFSFFNSKIDNFSFDYSRYECKKSFTFSALGVNILDELTINKRFVDVLKFQSINLVFNFYQILGPKSEIEDGDFQKPVIELCFINEKLSENPFNERKRLNFKLNSAPFEFILNKDLLARLNFMLKNPIVKK